MGHLVETMARVALALCVVLSLIGIVALGVWGTIYVGGSVGHRMALWRHSRTSRRTRGAKVRRRLFS